MAIPKALTEPMLSPSPVATTAQAHELAAHFIAVMDALVAVVERETALVRAGRLRAAGELVSSKSELTRLYIADTLVLRASHACLADMVPALLADIRLRHDAFRALLQTNLTVLATAHAVAEGIVRGVSDELARKEAPQTYGASGRALAPARSAARPLAVSRML